MLSTQDLLWIIVGLLCLIAGPLGWFVLFILAGALLLRWSYEGLASLFRRR